MNKATRRSGYTLIEMVLALAITTTLLMGMSASIVIASRTISDGLDVVGLALRTSDVLGEVNSDLSMAQAFVDRSDSAVTFSVPDRDGDGKSDVVRYWWTGPADGRLMKQINDGPEVSLAEDVRQFALTYGLSTMAAETAGDRDDDDGKKKWKGRKRRPQWGLYWDHRGHGWGHCDFMPGKRKGHDKDKGNGHWKKGGGDGDVPPPGSPWRDGWSDPKKDKDDKDKDKDGDDDDGDDDGGKGKGKGKK